MTAEITTAGATRSRLWCCQLDCDNDATWEIRAIGGGPDDYTHSCDEHIGSLLWDWDQGFSLTAITEQVPA